ncbi:MarC family protein [Bermanella sp. R86510]|uniref:MarC family protein n=1 Tax=unclassified Bermanella TaxID=2627862 RepID=UPI0037C9630D
MLETYIIAFTTLFAVVGPLDVAAVYAAITVGNRPEDRKHMAYRGVAIALGILLTFAFIGELLLAKLGISLSALKIAGGILLLLMAVDMVYARSSSGNSTTDEEQTEASGKQDISVFPLATPLLAGPGAMGATILLMAKASGDVSHQSMVIAAILSVMALSLILLLLAKNVQKIFGITGMHVISRIFGVLLCALAVQFMIDGILQSGIV